LFPADEDEHDDFVDAFTQTMALVRDQEILLAPKLDLEEPDEVDYNSRRSRRTNPYAA
jgi:hypothetical protein